VKVPHEGRGYPLAVGSVSLVRLSSDLRNWAGRAWVTKRRLSFSFPSTAIAEIGLDPVLAQSSGLLTQAWVSGGGWSRTYRFERAVYAFDAVKAREQDRR
jgi:hypothetical protein